MDVRKVLLAGSAALLLSGCVVRTGLLVSINNERSPMMGQAVATLISGKFEVSNLKGDSCKGTYNQYTQTPVLKVSVKCNDGRYGQVMVLRTGPNLTNGSGEGELNDGTKVKVLMGDMIHYVNAQGLWDKTRDTKKESK